MNDVEQQAIRRVLDGDRDAYGVLMERRFATAFRVAFRITGNHHDAEETTQEAFLRARWGAAGTAGSSFDARRSAEKPGLRLQLAGMFPVDVAALDSANREPTEN